MILRIDDIKSIKFNDKKENNEIKDNNDKHAEYENNITKSESLEVWAMLFYILKYNYWNISQRKKTK